jgi:hypothetical protein
MLPSLSIAVLGRGGNLKILSMLIESHTFFCRKSQHYILGDWDCYVPWFKNGCGEFNKEKLRFYMGFIPAYFRFMRLEIEDYFKK